LSRIETRREQLWCGPLDVETNTALIADEEEILRERLRELGYMT
jgi:hypothetical protein